MTHRTPAPIAVVEVWYNLSERSWVIQPKDAEGCQVDAAEYTADRDYAFATAELLAIGQGADLVHATMGMREIKVMIDGLHTRDVL